MKATNYYTTLTGLRVEGIRRLIHRNELLSHMRFGGEVYNCIIKLHIIDHMVSRQPNYACPYEIGLKLTSLLFIIQYYKLILSVILILK